MRRAISAGGQRRIDLELGEPVALLGLDRADDRDDQALLRAEVVDEHAVAGADRARRAAQAEVGEAVLGDVVDRRRASRRSRGVGRSRSTGSRFPALALPARECTIWYMYQMVQRSEEGNTA